jgi:hypothetical protein
MGERDGRDGRPIAGADQAGSSGKRSDRALSRQPIDPLTRARPLDTHDELLDDLPTEIPIPRTRRSVEQMEAILGDVTRLERDDPFGDDPTAEPPLTPDEPTLRDEQVVALPSIATVSAASEGGPSIGAAPSVGGSNGAIDVRVPDYPVQERHRPTGPLPIQPYERQAAQPDSPSAAAGPPAKRAASRRRRPTAYEGVAAKPATRQRKLVKRLLILGALAAMGGALWLLRTYGG